MLGKATDPEDRMPIEPFYLGHMVNASEVRMAPTRGGR
jgi:hypothetical protein